MVAVSAQQGPGTHGHRAHACLAAQVRSQDGQLGVAQRQLDVRQQELQAQLAALHAAQQGSQQLQDSVAQLAGELAQARRDAEAGACACAARVPGLVLLVRVRPRRSRICCCGTRLPAARSPQAAGR
jgi:hypothetical protein